MWEGLKSINITPDLVNYIKISSLVGRKCVWSKTACLW